MRTDDELRQSAHGRCYACGDSDSNLFLVECHAAGDECSEYVLLCNDCNSRNSYLCPYCFSRTGRLEWSHPTVADVQAEAKARSS